MILLNENSGLVKIWARNVKAGNVAREDVPNLSNLREMVFKILDDNVTA
ncbi:hypothetical protein [Clostridium senegalense]